MNKMPIYVDNNATTPLDPRVLEAMMPYFGPCFGNAGSATHAYGWQAKAAVEKARRQIADLIGACANEIFFTSGATESNNMALLGTMCVPNALVTSAIEHPSVLACCQELQRRGAQISVVPVTKDGFVDVAQFVAALKDQTQMASVMFVNNEIGTIQPIQALAEACKSRGVLFHCDAVQAAGRVPIDVKTLGVHMLSLSAHKMYGPKGVGALYVQKDVQSKLHPLIFGGGQECCLRPGTHNVAGIVGMGFAAQLSGELLASEEVRIEQLRDHLWQGLKAALGESVQLNGALSSRVAGNLNISFEGIDGEELLLEIQNQIALSAGSACSSAKKKPSHVLSALGFGPERIQSALRIGLGRFNTPQETKEVHEYLVAAVLKLKSGMLN